MTKFSQMEYRRPDFQSVFDEGKSRISEMRSAKSAQEMFGAMQKLDKLTRTLATQRTLAHVRYTINTRDAFYDAENTVFDEEMPRFEEISTEAARAMLESPFRKDIAEKYGEHHFSIAGFVGGMAVMAISLLLL